MKFMSIMDKPRSKKWKLGEAAKAQLSVQAHEKIPVVNLSRGSAGMNIVNSVKNHRKNHKDDYLIRFMLNMNSRKFEDLIRKKIREIIVDELEKLLNDSIIKNIDPSNFSSPSKPFIVINNCRELTRREKEIMELVVDKMTNQQIAKILSLKINTVKNHMKNITAKYGVHFRWEAREAFLRLQMQTQIKSI